MASGWKNRQWWFLVLAVSCCGWLTAGEMVVKVADSFDGLSWKEGGYNRASGSVALSKETAPDAGSGGSVEMKVSFSGKGFEFFSAEPVQPLVIPGDAKMITLRVKRSDGSYGLSVVFSDGWGRTKVNGKDLKWNVKIKKTGAWETVSFQVPGDWVRPVRINSVATHNWGKNNRKADCSFWLDRLEVETDIGGIDPATGLLKGWTPEPNPADKGKALKEPFRTPLVGVACSTPEQSNVFSRTAPELRVQVRNWKAGALTGTVECVVRDNTEKELGRSAKDISVESGSLLAFPLNVKAFGRYHADVHLKLSDGTDTVERVTFAKIPPYRDLSDAEKDASPYGVNVHGGATILPYVPFKKAGLVWFRDYAFEFATMNRANSDGQWGGWPWYRNVVKRYRDLGLRLLPCSQNSISKIKLNEKGTSEGELVPSRKWTGQTADHLLGFPGTQYWELDNEYDLDKEAALAELATDWKHYRDFHKSFAKLVSILSAGEMKAVENGRAGVWPDRLKTCIESGDFADIDVVNSHHYCGVEPPEVNFGNMNTGFSESHRKQDPSLFFDRLRDVKRIAQMDGKARQSWLTEFGWDTLAGHVVSPYEQAVYLPRAWMMGLTAGTDKMFWFYHYDSAKPNNFFDGCGLLAPLPKGQPKLSLCTLAGLTSLMPNPKPVGQINAGENTWGYVFEQGDALIASLFTIKGDKGPDVSFKAKQLYDCFGNKIAGKSHALTMAPVYAVGLDKDDLWYKQTAYGLHTHYLMLATAGDALASEIEVKNNRDAAIDCTVKLELPNGWTTETPAVSATVAPGETKRIPFACVVASNETLGERRATFVISENGKDVKQIPLRVLIRDVLSMQVGPIKGRPGKTTVTVKLLNQSRKPLDGTLRLKLPASWKAETPEQAIKQLVPNVVQSIEVPFTWSADWKANESASIEFVVDANRRAEQPLIPNTYRIPKAKGIVCDGDVTEWPAQARLPEWMIGSSLGKPGVKLYAAWAENGLYIAAAVMDSKINASDPRSFWNGDCLELFVDTADNKKHRFYEPGDHQFWCVPQVGQNRVYVGQWKRKQEIPATKYDIQGIKSASKKVGNGYVMEFFLPASAMVNYKAQVGGHIGLCVNVTVYGERFQRQAYWPWTKDWSVQNLPKTWGTMEMVE